MRLVVERVCKTLGQLKVLDRCRKRRKTVFWGVHKLVYGEVIQFYPIYQKAIGIKGGNFTCKEPRDHLPHEITLEVIVKSQNYMW